MGKHPKLEVLTIPEAALTPKAWYTTREMAEAALPAIRSWIRNDNPPHLFPGHTHSPPPADGRIEYLDEFELPKTAREQKRFAPCPCCTPRTPKYGVGRVAWFPDEGVIRLMGCDCFVALNADAHHEAEARMRVEKKRKTEVAYLLRNHDKVAPALAGLREALPIAAALDQARLDVLDRLQRIKVDLWPHVRRGGTLMVSRRETEVTTSQASGHGSREIDVDRVYATLSGFSFFAPDTKSVERRLRTAISTLEAVDFVGPDVAARIETLDEADRAKAAKLMARGLQGGRAVLDELAELRRGVSVESTATLRNWSQVPGSPLPGLYIRREGNSLSIGRSDYSVMRIELGRALDFSLPHLPDLGLSGAEAA